MRYYRDKDQKEIDILISKDNALYPVEFKKSASPRKDDTVNFRLLERLGAPIGDVDNASNDKGEGICNWVA